MTTKAMRGGVGGLSLQNLGGELLILDQGVGMIHQLNETASLIWQKSEAGLSPQAVAQVLVESYEIGEEVATRDVVDTLERLQALNLVSVAK